MPCSASPVLHFVDRRSGHAAERDTQAARSSSQFSITQIRQQIQYDLASRIEVNTAHDFIWNICKQQFLLKAGLCVGTVENCIITVLLSLVRTPRVISPTYSYKTALSNSGTAADRSSTSGSLSERLLSSWLFAITSFCRIPNILPWNGNSAPV